MAFLVVRAGEPAGVSFRLEGPSSTIGRSAKAQIQFSNMLISNMHAEVVEIDGKHQIRDLGSSNGTFCHSQPIGSTPVQLNHGDYIDLSDQVRLEYFSESDTPTVVDHRAPSGFTVDELAREVFLAGEPLRPALTRQQFDVLKLLYSKEGMVCAFQAIDRVGWPTRARGDVAPEDRYTLMKRIRDKLDGFTDEVKLIQSVRGLGYKMVIPPELRDGGPFL